MSVTEVASAVSAAASAAEQDELNPAGAARRAAKWRRALAAAVGEDPGGALDEPRTKLLLLKIFGSTRRLADFCMQHPVAAAEALCDGPAGVLAAASRDVAELDGAVGGPDALRAALGPIKARVDLSLAIAELAGERSAAQAAATRAEFAERYVEAALCWLIRAGANRGEFDFDLDEGPAQGVFALAGGDFAHKSLSPFGPLDLVVLYDGAVAGQGSAGMTERAFLRLGADLREAFEGKPGDYPIFTLKTPLGTGVQGAGFVETLARARGAREDEQRIEWRAFLASARVAAGDRKAAGEFLEECEEAVWGEYQSHALLDCVDSAPPCGAYRRLAHLIRMGLGAVRPVFRTATIEKAISGAGASGIFSQAAANRLAAGYEFAQRYASLTQIMRGDAATAPEGEEEKEALAELCGFSSHVDLQTVLAGAFADAENAVTTILDGPQAAMQRYKLGDGDEATLEDLGFADGAVAAAFADAWANSGETAEPQRFAALAPGLLTAFGETQYPDEAIHLFDALISDDERRDGVMEAVREAGPARDAIVDAFGCFTSAVKPIFDSASASDMLARPGGPETPQTAAEWLARRPAPKTPAKLAEIAAWRRETIGEATLAAAAGVIDFACVASTLDAIAVQTVKAVFDSTPEATRVKGLSLHVFDRALHGAPGGQGAPVALGFVATQGASEAGEAAARAVLDALVALDDGYFALRLDIGRRPGGGAGALAPGIADFKAYLLSEACAGDQVLAARARPVAGSDKSRSAVLQVLRASLANPRRTDVLFRDLDRARAQKKRAGDAISDWDVTTIDGGLDDVELIVNALIYRHAGALPAARNEDAGAALDALARAGRISRDAAATLQSAHDFWSRLAAAKALSGWEDPREQTVRGRFARVLARAGGVSSFSQLRPLMCGYAEEVNRLYAQLVLGRPVARLVASA